MIGTLPAGCLKGSGGRGGVVGIRSFHSPGEQPPVAIGSLAPFLPVFRTGEGRGSPGLEGSIPSPRRSAAIRFRARPARGEVGVAARDTD